MQIKTHMKIKMCIREKTCMRIINKDTHTNKDIFECGVRSLIVLYDIVVAPYAR